MDRFSHFLVEQGVDKGHSFTVPEEGGRLGRSSKNDFNLKDENLSREHCEFFFKEGKLWIRDLESSNSTLLNQKPVKEAQLKKGDRVTVGETQLLILLTAARPKLSMRKDVGPQAGKTPQLKLDRPSPFVRFIALPLWILLTLWLAFLGYSVLRDSSTTSPRTELASASDLEPVYPDTSGDTAESQATALDIGSRPPPSEKREPESPAVKPPVVSSRPPSTGTTVTPTPTPTPRSETPNATATSRTSGSEAVDALARSMVFKAMKGEYVAAQEELLNAMSGDDSPHNRLLINEMSSYIRTLSGMDDTLVNLLGAKMGETISLTRGSGRVQVRIDSMTGDVVKGMESSSAGDREISFKVGSIPPLDQCHLLGVPDTKAQHFVHCILHMKAADYDGAARYSSNTGVMQNTLNDILAQLRQ